MILKSDASKQMLDASIEFSDFDSAGDRIQQSLDDQINKKLLKLGIKKPPNRSQLGNISIIQQSTDYQPSLVFEKRQRSTFLPSLKVKLKSNRTGKKRDRSFYDYALEVKAKKISTNVFNSNQTTERSSDIQHLVINASNSVVKSSHGTLNPVDLPQIEESEIELNKLTRNNFSPPKQYQSQQMLVPSYSGLGGYSVNNLDFDHHKSTHSLVTNLSLKKIQVQDQSQQQSPFSKFKPQNDYADSQKLSERKHLLDALKKPYKKPNNQNSKKVFHSNSQAQIQKSYSQSRKDSHSVIKDHQSSFRRQKQSIFAMEDNSKVQCVIHRKYDKNSKDDIFLVLENKETGRIDQELEKEPLRLYDAHQIEIKKIKNVQQMREYEKSKHQQASGGYPEEKIKSIIFDLQAKKGLGEKKDFYFDKVRLFNNSLLEIGGEEKTKKRNESFQRIYREIAELNEETRNKKYFEKVSEVTQETQSDIVAPQLPAATIQPEKSLSPVKQNIDFPSAYHMAMKIRTNEKAMIKFLSKGRLPKELDDPVEDSINNLNEGRKRYLANYSSKIGVKPEQNLFLHSMKVDEEYGTSSKKDHKKSRSEISNSKKFVYIKKSASQLLIERTDNMRNRMEIKKKHKHQAEIEKIMDISKDDRTFDQNESIDFQRLIMDFQSCEVADEDQFKEIKNAMDRYYDSHIFKQMDDEGISNKVIIKETTDIIKKRFGSKKKLDSRVKKSPLKIAQRHRPTFAIEKDIIKLLANEQKMLDEGRSKLELYHEIKAKLDGINLQNFGVKKKLFDNFESVQRYSEILMRNDDSFTAKKRLKYEEQVKLKEKKNEFIKVLKKMGVFNENGEENLPKGKYNYRKIDDMDQEQIENLENKLNSNYNSSEEYSSEKQFKERKPRQSVKMDHPFIISSEQKLGRGASQLDILINQTKRQVERKKFSKI